MRLQEEATTRALLAIFTWHAVDDRVAEVAGDLGRRWLPSNRGIDSAYLAIAATAVLLHAELLTRNVNHFPMFSELSAPY
jgi:predicted nucleic acid-binding protein